MKFGFISLFSLILLGSGIYYAWISSRRVPVDPEEWKQTTMAHASLGTNDISSFRALPIVNHEATPEVKLGYLLFKEPKLSSTNTISCASCHDLSKYGADQKRFSIGVKGIEGDSNSPSVFNSSLNFAQFWNGRATTLSEQAHFQISDPKEMNSNWDDIVEKLKSDPKYVRAFMSAFNGDISRKTILQALTSFENTLLTPDSPFDRYLRGDSKALNEEQLRGYEKFESLGCVACHQGINIGGNMFQTMGVMGDYFKDRKESYASDAGRYEVTGRDDDMHVFKVPSLRNVAMTAPYFHDGQAATLEQAIQLMGKYQLGQDLTPQDVRDLSAFLHALTGSRPEILNRLQREAE